MAKGVNALVAAAAHDKEQTIKAKATPKPNISKEESSTESETSKSEDKKKHAGGRPSYGETGETLRKQYTITLTPEFYETIKEYRKTHRSSSGKIQSFADFLADAASEYMENHK